MALTWFSTAEQPTYPIIDSNDDRLATDFNLELVYPSGATTISAIPNNNFEIIEYSVRQVLAKRRVVWSTGGMSKHHALPHVTLSAADQAELEALLAGGTQPVRVCKRALGLLELHRGKTITAVAAMLGVTNDTIARWRDGYEAHALHALHDAPRPGRPPTITGPQRAQVTALACSTPPAGQSQWSLRLLADKVVELGYCETISHTTVSEILKKTNSSPT